LRDGTDAFVLPLQRTDKAALVAEFETLAPDSRRRRFLAPVMHLSDSMLKHLVDDVDGVDHVALVLCVETSTDVYEPIALARMVRYPDVPDAADLAVTVKDAWQGRGVATALLEVLMRERCPGVDRIVTEVYSDNAASLSMLRDLGPSTVKDVGSGLSEVVVELAPVEGTVPAVESAGAEADQTPDEPAADVSESWAALLRDRARRQVLRSRDQVCPWFS
jgi:ribosomal protein S18 acetylase RimI-like enzyme